LNLSARRTADTLRSAQLLVSTGPLGQARVYIFTLARSTGQTIATERRMFEDFLSTVRLTPATADDSPPA